MRKRTAWLLCAAALVLLLNALSAGASTAPWSLPWVLVPVGMILGLPIGLAAAKYRRNGRDQPELGIATERSGHSDKEAAPVVEIDEVDGLTSLGNRRRLDRDLRPMLERAVDPSAPVAFAIINVDNFRLYNEAHGHIAGDEVLRRLTRVIIANVRDEDVVYRYGGEEFSVLLRGANRGLAHEIVHRVRAAIEAASFPGEASQPGGSLTVSVGVSAVPQCEPAALRQQAHEALSSAKEAGRNQVAFATARARRQHLQAKSLRTPAPTPVG